MLPQESQVELDKPDEDGHRIKRVAFHVYLL